MGDETETLKHEKILEEQLIKDFELMGNKLELVDDSSHRIQIHASPSGSTTSNTLTGQQQQQQQEQQPIAAAPSISQVVAGTGTSFVSGTTCDFISNVATSASARRQSLASSSRDNSSSIDSSATIATTITAQRTTNLLASEQKLHQKAADQAIKSDVSSASLKGNEGRQSSSNNRRPLGESLVANSDEQEHFERLILMDIEGKFSQLFLNHSLSLSLLYGLAQCCSDEYKTLSYFPLPFTFQFQLQFLLLFLFLLQDCLPDCARHAPGPLRPRPSRSNTKFEIQEVPLSPFVRC